MLIMGQMEKKEKKKDTHPTYPKTMTQNTNKLNKRLWEKYFSNNNYFSERLSHTTQNRTIAHKLFSLFNTLLNGLS